MKSPACMLALIALVAPSLAGAAHMSPISKVLTMLGDLETKIIAEGEEAHKIFAEFSEWCEDRSRNLGFEIKTGKAEIQELNAKIDEETATAAALTTKIEELSSSIATDEADLKAAVGIREKETADFAAEEKELMDIISTLERAINLLSKHNSASLLQETKGVNNVIQAITAMVQASVFDSADAKRLSSFAQAAAAQTDEDSDGLDEAGAPAAAVYEGHSGGITDVLQNLLDKAQEQLDQARKKETAAANNFAMLKQSLEDSIKFGNKDLDDAKKGIAASGQAKATAEGDLAATSKELAEDLETKEGLHQNCQTTAEDFELETKSRAEELKALAAAKKVLKESTGGADEVAYGLGQVSLLQVGSSGLRTGSDLAHFEAVRFVRKLANEKQSTALAQLAQRMASAMRVSQVSGEDPFVKVKGLITDMIEKLEDEAGADASHKAYCDKELSESNAKKDEKTAEIEKLSTKIDQSSARSAQLKDEVAMLQAELAKLAKAQADMDAIRKEENTVYVSNKADMEKGLEGVKTALKVLNEYYSKAADHSAASGAGGSIIGLLEVVESDLTKGLAEMNGAEENALSTYEAETKANAIDKTEKDQSVKYKTKEYKELDKAKVELTADKTGVQTELDAVLAYLKSLHDQCDAKAEPYAERTARRTAEIAGLKQALQILEGETVLLQQTARERSLRAVQRHMGRA